MACADNLQGSTDERRVFEADEAFEAEVSGEVAAEEPVVFGVCGCLFAGDVSNDGSDVP